MAGQTSSFMVTVLRPTRTSREECVVNASRLVPGDVLVLPPNGNNKLCISIGESVPVMKGPPCPSGETYSTETHKRHTLFAGTHVLAKVVRTGFSTAKGELIRSILYPTAASFKFYTDAVKFVMFMFLIAALGIQLHTIVLRTLDIITIVVPPALPAAMTAGIVQSQKRLQKLKIFCVSPPRIIVAGKLQTGTLTEDGLDFYGVIPSETGVKFGERVDKVTALTSTSPLVQALASCHSLTTPAVVKPAATNSQNLDNYDPFTMEVPYEIADMCTKDSLPDNFSSVLNDYTWNGHRVISLAYKKLDRKMKWVDAQRVHRETLECDMAFLGFLVMQNSLKPETTQVIKDLHAANIRQVMVTGDNIMTAMSVARGCFMVKQHQKIVLVTIGEGTNDEKPPIHMKETRALYWDRIMYMPWKGRHGVVYGRFGPDQKTQLITALQNQDDTVVGMCGDGANDCGALKAAHNILCVKRLVMEGRCALSTSFAIFKYMSLYSLIQFISILILYKFLYIDLVLTTLMALSLGRAKPGPKLTKQSPPVSLVSWGSIVPLVIQVLVVLVFKEVEGGPDVEVVRCWENTVVFIISSFQYLNMACVYAKGWPFRQPFCTNYAMVATLITQAVFIVSMAACPWGWLADLMEIQLMDLHGHPNENTFRLYLLLIPSAMFSDPDKCTSCYKFVTRPCSDKEEPTDEDDALLRPPAILPLC
ncbi:putative ATPase type 13A3 [Operophtera brumata]|uniref:Putative ATPase type 13A3 n=1 Tax=Operophtera brumata TaxID=104452 RepID=A0A0L7LGE7_OPEBR|nr:putative ATPase type 13A3 [Operophtera brumata]